MKYFRYALISAGIASYWLVGLTMPAWSAMNEEANPALQEFLRRILSEHPALKAAEAELDAARWRAQAQAQSLYNPSIELDYEDIDDEERTKKAGLSQTIDVWGKRPARARVAAAEVSGAKVRLDIVRKTLLANLLTALSEYETNRDMLAIAETRVKLNQDFLALTERRYQAGDVPQTDLLTAQMTLAEAQATASAAQVDLSLSEGRVSQIIGGLPPSASMVKGLPPQTLPPFETIDVETLPELRMSTAEIEAARFRVQVAQRNQFPDPTVGLSVGEQDTSPPLIPTQSSTLFGVTLSIPLPILNPFRAEVDEAAANLVASEQSRRDLRRNVVARLETSHKRYTEALAAWSRWTEQGAQPLESQRALLRRLFEAGEISAVEYIVQLNQTFAIEGAGVSLRGRLWATWFEWLDASALIDEWVKGLQ